MKKLFFMFILLFIGIFLGACGGEKKFNFDDDVLIVGLEAVYPPFNWTETEASETNHPIDGTNQYVDGYDVQMAKLIAKELDLELKIKKIDWEGLIESLKSGMIDVIIAGMSPTKDRLESISFTDEYYASTHVVLVKEDSKYGNANVFADFKDATIVGQRGTTYDKLAKQLADKGEGKYQAALDTVPQIVHAINNEMVDATILEEPVAKSIISTNPDLKYIKLDTEFELSYEDKVVSIGVRKNDEELLERLNTALSKISDDTRNQLMDTAVVG